MRDLNQNIKKVPEPYTKITESKTMIKSKNFENNINL